MPAHGRRVRRQRRPLVREANRRPTRSVRVPPVARVGSSDLDVFPLCLGGNVFGWTADEEASFAVLDAYAAAGGNFIDTADVYSSWVPGHTGGESETIIGRWLASRNNRDSMVVATKVGHNRDLRRQAILEGAKRSLERLQTDRIDLYYAHNDDPDTPLEEALGAFGELVAEGKVRYIGASNFTAERLSAGLDVAEREGLPAYVALQNEYNLVDRDYEQGPRQVVASRGLAVVPYSGLAAGFLTGKYRPNGAAVDSPRAQRAVARLDERGLAVLAALDEVAAAHHATQAAVALAWLLAQPTVVAPIASARTVAQLDELLAFTALSLSPRELEALSRAG
jgi:aryl-alcohol dehydrogenase-like predicted oxidoreductase